MGLHIRFIRFLTGLKKNRSNEDLHKFYHKNAQILNGKSDLPIKNIYDSIDLYMIEM